MWLHEVGTLSSPLLQHKHMVYVRFITVLYRQACFMFKGLVGVKVNIIIVHATM